MIRLSLLQFCCVLLAILPLALASTLEIDQVLQPGVSHHAKARAAAATDEEWALLNRFLHQYDEVIDKYDQGPSSDDEARFLEARASGGPCASLKSTLCKPCFKIPKPFKPCDKWEATCHRLFCAPLCLRLLWEVDITPAGGSPEFQEELAKENVKAAVEAQMMAYGCKDILGCCDAGETIDNWAEERYYQGSFPQIQGISACLKEPDAAKAKAMCSVAVKVKPIEGACDKFVEPLVAKENPHAPAAFTRAKLSAASEKPKHASFHTRCVKLQKIVAGQAGGMVAKFKAAACACLGCDESKKCPTAVTYNNIKSVLKEFDSDAMDYEYEPPAAAAEE